MDKIIILILLTVIGSVTRGNAQLQCHVCINCPNPGELGDSVEQCIPQTTTTAPPEDTTTVPPGDTTTVPPGDTTTVPPEDPTTAPPGDTTTVPPVDTTTTPPGDTTTAPPGDTTLPPTLTPPVDTTPDPIITTQPPPITPPSTTPQVPVSPPDFLRQKWLHGVRQTPSEFQCFVVHRTVGDSVQVNRGCVVTRDSIAQTCADANEGQEPQLCQLCTSDGCNNMDTLSIASKYVVSLTILLSSLFITFTIR